MVSGFRETNLKKITMYFLYFYLLFETLVLKFTIDSKVYIIYGLYRLQTIRDKLDFPARTNIHCTRPSAMQFNN